MLADGGGGIGEEERWGRGTLICASWPDRIVSVLNFLRNRALFGSGGARVCGEEGCMRKRSVGQLADQGRKQPTTLTGLIRGALSALKLCPRGRNMGLGLDPPAAELL